MAGRTPDGRVRVQDGKVTVEKGTARLGKASVEFALETRAPAEPTPDEPRRSTGTAARGSRRTRAPLRQPRPPRWRRSSSDSS